MNKYLLNALLTISAIAIAYLVYSNHFHNAFHFDDFHTIVENKAILSIKNIPSFFTDATTTSTLPANQAYRPGLTTLNTIDIFLSGNTKPDPFQFHLSIFISFLLLAFFIYLLIFQLLNQISKTGFNKGIAYFATLFFLVHTANAETINYIIARSDSFSALSVVASFICYIYFPALRKWYFYFIPALLGFFVKEQALMFLPLLFVYQLLFEENIAFGTWLKNGKKCLNKLLQLWLPIVLSVLVFIISRKLTPEGWSAGGTTLLNYLFTQPFVIFHYTYNFLLPLNLVVDTDWTAVASLTDERVLAGILFILFLCWQMIQCSKHNTLKPVAFGIAWFLICLLPTSSFIPFAEVLNDHRPFLPYIGLFISTASLVQYLQLHKIWMASSAAKFALMGIAIIVLSAHAIGTYQRNKIWLSEESLWKEATVKAPNNGRAWMNYGNTLLAKSDFVEAENCYKKTVSLWPNYAYAYTNLAIVNSITNKKEAAVAFFNQSLSLNALVPETYAFYAEHFIRNHQLDEAKLQLDKGLAISPRHQQFVKIATLLQQAQPVNEKNNTNKIEALIALINLAPTAENYLNLSLAQYQYGAYQPCIDAAKKALEVNPNYDLAYNNICAAYNQLGKYDEAIDAANKGIAINPNNQLLKGNLAEAYRRKNNK